MSDTVTPEELGALQFSAPLSAEVRRRLADFSRRRQFAAGQTVFREGERVAVLYLVEQGTVALDMYVPSRGSVRILSLGPGELLGWSALVGDSVMTATAVSLGETTLIAIDGPALQQLCDEDLDAGRTIMLRMATALSRRLLATRLQLLDLYSETSPQVVMKDAAAPVRERLGSESPPG